ncbi:MAG TPA: hypothetical protein VFA55_08170 [Candidatus Kapabacteria bacterium]|nr:hypothetical protein [Candidatus Kapabacteria bacterium]
MRGNGRQSVQTKTSGDLTEDHRDEAKHYSCDILLAPEFCDKNIHGLADQ